MHHLNERISMWIYSNIRAYCCSLNKYLSRWCWASSHPHPPASPLYCTSSMFVIIIHLQTTHRRAVILHGLLANGHRNPSWRRDSVRTLSRCSAAGAVSVILTSPRRQRHYQQIILRLARKRPRIHRLATNAIRDALHE